MSRIGSWLRGGAPAKAHSIISKQNATSTAEELQDLADAMTAATMVINDDVDGADTLLKLRDSSFHRLGRGVTQFIRSLLGFEQDIMKEAAERLSAAENLAWDDMRRAQRNGSRTSEVYSPGSEYALCYAESLLMSAVVAVLNESLTESIKGFYKLRKAYVTLDALMVEEDRYVKQRLGGGSSTASLTSSYGKTMPGGFEESRPTSTKGNSTINDSITNQQIEAPPALDDDDSDLEFIDADESHTGANTPIHYLGHLESKDGRPMSGDGKIQGMNGLATNGARTPAEYSDGETAVPEITATTSGFGNDPASDLFHTPVDVFIHSGTNMCYGMLQLILSMVPPAFSRLLSIIGFRGDKERGLTLLWQSCRCNNINGAVSGLVLLGYYNGLAGFCDILPDPEREPDDILGYPRQRCEQLLAEMRVKYTESRLWKLEEARMLSSNKKLHEAIAVLNKSTDSKMKQINAMNMFEKSLTCMYAHEYLECAKSFEACMELNTWSHCLYTYVIACCHVELYRNTRASDPKEAQKWKDSATELLKEAPTHAGKKRFMAKQLPFDVFVARKVQKWEERAKSWNCSIVDVIGVSPIEEMIYLWNGAKKMPSAELDKSLERLQWANTTYPEKHENDIDETGLKALLQVSLIRSQKKYDEARRILQKDILSHDRNDFKGHLKDDWTCPAAHYEMAVLAWLEKDLEGQDEQEKIKECEEWLAKVSKWDGYVLDTRIGLKIAAANDTLKRHKEKCGFV